MMPAQLQLALGHDHPLRDAAAELDALQLHAARDDRAGQPDRDRGAGAEVPGAADDLARLGFAQVDLAQL
jgi:hypothetical protein